MKQSLRGLSTTAALRAGEAAAEHLSDSQEWKNAACVTFFSTLAGEVETAPLVRRAQRDGKRLYFPRMIPGSSLEFVYVSDVESMRYGRYRVLEPVRGAESEMLTSNGLILVPGMAFDRRGGRLGRGGGYYDRALAGFDREADRIHLVGLCFAVQLVEAVPMNSVDVRMDRVLTENGFCVTG
jgi:5-formyltetrahydrofolate cyclo-ligase